MLIRVKYVNDTFDMVRPETLDRLLGAGEVLEFRRCEGWVMPGMDTLRRKNRRDYSGPDRRNRRAEDRRTSADCRTIS